MPSPGQGETHPEEDAISGAAVMMSTFATAGGGVGVAYTDTAFRNLGLLQFQDTNALADLEGVVVQVRKPSAPRVSHVPERNYLVCRVGEPLSFKVRRPEEGWRDLMNPSTRAL